MPLVSLHIRNTVKEDLDCSAAELVFGQTIKLLGQSHPNISKPITPPHQFLEKLKGYFDFVKSQQTSNHSNLTAFVDKNLADCSHMWLRCEKKTHSLQPRYRVLQRNDKNFRIMSFFPHCVFKSFFPHRSHALVVYLHEQVHKFPQVKKKRDLI